MTSALYNYAEFFEGILYRVCMNMIKENTTIIEFKQIFGMVYDEDGHLDVERELGIFLKVEKQIKARFPLFQMKIVICGLKIVGKAHV